MGKCPPAVRKTPGVCTSFCLLPAVKSIQRDVGNYLISFVVEQESLKKQQLFGPGLVC
jgi:hypothetical protein